MDVPAALAGVRVLDLADATGSYCAKLLADMGADVVKVAPPGGDPARIIPPFLGAGAEHAGGLCFLYHNTNKRSLVLDVETASGHATFRRLARTADVVLDTATPGRMDALGLGGDTLRAVDPRLVTTSITGFGRDGPHALWASDDIVASALGGAMHVTGHADDPPVVLAGWQTWIAGSTCAAAATLIALRHARRTGRGQHVDVSIEEVAAAVTHICGVGKWLDDGIVPKRFGTGLFASVPSGAYRCTDGLVYLMINRPAHWKALARWIHEVTGNEEVLDPMFDGPSSSRLPYRELLDLFIGDLTERFTVEHVYREGQSRHLAFTPVNGALDVLRDPHLAARGYFVDVELTRGHAETLTLPGAPYRHGATPWRITRTAPAPGEHTEAIMAALDGDLAAREREREDARERDARRGGDGEPSHPAAPAARPDGGATEDALAGLRVLELTAGMAGPWIGRYMAYCGAEVIKIESHAHPDVTRLYVPPRRPELGIQPQLSPWFTDWNAGKRFIALDLTRPAAVALCKRLVAVSDVVVANYSPGVLAKLGLGYEELRAARPDVILLSSTGFGETGPHSPYVTWGPNIEAVSGLSALSGFAHRECTVTQYAYPDALSALHGLVAVLCALAHRERTGEGQAIDLSQYEVTVAALGPSIMEASAQGYEAVRLGNASRTAAPHGVYACAGEDRWCAISVRSDEEWRRLCGAIARDDLAADVRLTAAAGRVAYRSDVDGALGAWTRERDAYEVMETLQGAGVRAGVVQTVEDQFVRDEQLRARAFFEEIEHAKKGRVTAVGVPLGLTATPGRTRSAGAAVGADNAHVFKKVLGMSDAEFAEYASLGAIEEP